MSEDFYGIPVGTLESERLRLQFLADRGPRIVRLFLKGEPENILAETPEAGWRNAYGDFRLYGGHRLWHAPEVPDLTSVPDNAGLEVEAREEGILLRQPPEKPTGIAKEIEICLPARQNEVRLVHRLRNAGPRPVELAPWAITQLPPGGQAILPQFQGVLNDNPHRPNRSLVLWPGSQWDDTRLLLGREAFTISAEPGMQPFKVGYFNSQGWVAYQRAGILFCKRFRPQVDRPHADLGCNVEVFAGPTFIELETLGPLVSLRPGECAEHEEVWEIRLENTENAVSGRILDECFQICQQDLT